jgi:hypothetical protein
MVEQFQHWSRSKHLLHSLLRLINRSGVARNL